MPPSSPRASCSCAGDCRGRAPTRARSSRIACGGRSCVSRPSERRRKWTAGNASASRSTASETCAVSVASPCRNFRRAGTLKNRSRTSTCVPTGAPTLAPLARRCRLDHQLVAAVAVGGVARARGQRQLRHRRDRRQRLAAKAHRRERAQIVDGRQLRGRVALEREVRVVGRHARSRRRRPRMSPRPPPSISTSMRRAPASSAFSTSSLTTDAGRSTTSPAAIWSASSGGSTRIRETRLIVYHMQAREPATETSVPTFEASFSRNY